MQSFAFKEVLQDTKQSPSLRLQAYSLTFQASFELGARASHIPFGLRLGLLPGLVAPPKLHSGTFGNPANPQCMCIYMHDTAHFKKTDLSHGIHKDMVSCICESKSWDRVAMREIIRQSILCYQTRDLRIVMICRYISLAYSVAKLALKSGDVKRLGEFNQNSPAIYYFGVANGLACVGHSK